MTTFHPDLRSAARWLPRGVGRRWLLPILRRLPSPAVPLPAHITMTERVIDERSGVTVRVFQPRGEQLRPAVLWIHGGGYIIGSAQQDDSPCVHLANQLNAVVVAVNYRLAPEHPFPTPLEDCFAAWSWLLCESSSLTVDPSRMIVAGRSAGGGLAAALTLLLHDRQQPKPVLQVLVYPMLDDRTVLRDVDGSHHRLWDQRSNQLGWSCYLAAKPGAPDISDHAAPARRVDLSGLPPTWIGVGTMDLFHDEDVLFANRLREAGVPVSLEVVPGAFHGFEAALPNKPVSQQFTESYLSAMRDVVA